MDVKFVDVIDNFRDFVDEVFVQAIERNASDIHFEPQKDFVLIRYRIDGEIYPLYQIESTNKDNLTTRVKILANMKIDESRMPQDGQIVFPYESEEIDMRVSTFPVLYGEKVVIRILKKDIKLLNINSLGFLQINLNTINKALSMKEGLILVSGPTGSGKTTTLYAMLGHFDPNKYNIATLEDPVEYKLAGINQSQVKPEIGYDFSNGLRALLRQDPDIILVGEVRDKKTAMLALEASLTGHLVLGTIHANKGVGVVERLTNMGIEPYLVASALKLIVSQRLVKKMCVCAKTVELQEHEEMIFSQGLGKIWDNVKNNIKMKDFVGCDKCMNQGTLGRLALHDVVMMDSDFVKWISSSNDKKEWDEIMEKKGYLTLFQDGLLKAASGLINLKQVLPYKDI